VTRPKKLGAGLVMLMAHVLPELRDRVRSAARDRGWTVSRFMVAAIERGAAELEKEANGLDLPVSRESVRMLDELVRMGIFGSSRGEVAARFVDQALQAYTTAGILRKRNGPSCPTPRKPA
jgi:uncharacterized protein (DUF1778 family)